MIISLYWLEPEEDSWINVEVTDASDEEMTQIRDWSKERAGLEWGVTIPSIRLHKGVSPNNRTEKISLEDFAAAIRYSTGEEIYSEDCPVFLTHGIAR